jgi:hypothetical protein
MLAHSRHAVSYRPLAALCLAATLASAALGSAAPAGKSAFVNISVLESTPKRITVQCQVIDFVQRDVDVNGQPYAVIMLPHEASLLQPGAPDLPHVARSVIIPDTGEMTAQVVEGQSAYYDIPNVAVAPSKGNLLRNVDPAQVPYEFGEVYHTSGFFPGPLATLHEPYILRDRRGAVVDFFPFQYDVATRILRVYTCLTVDVLRVADGGANVLDRTTAVSRPSRAFEDLYRVHFINYDATLTYAPRDETGSLLIICHDPWIPNVQPLVEHKNQIGISTSIVGVSTFGGSETAIKDYIQTLYNRGDLAFVLLVGDAEQVPTFSVLGGASDPTYALLAGDDHYPEIMVGRFSAQTPEQVDTQVLRTIRYEDRAATHTDWFWRGTGIGSEFGPGDNGEYDYVHIGIIRTLLLGSGYTLVDGFYGPDHPTAQMVSDAVNAGRGIINYCGHGNVNSWGTTGFWNGDIDNLVDDNELPFIFSVGCANGEFSDFDPCFAEAWLRATHNGQPTGAIATYMSSVNQYWDPPMRAQDEFNERLVDPSHSYHSLGTLCFAGSCGMMDAYGQAGWDMSDTWHVFGDPSLRVVGTVWQPGDLNCDGLVNDFDITPFVKAITSASLYEQLYPDCDILNGDINGDGLVNNFDITPFVHLLTGG